jgi:hypothetical protein
MAAIQIPHITPASDPISRKKPRKMARKMKKTIVATMIKSSGFIANIYQSFQEFVKVNVSTFQLVFQGLRVVNISIPWALVKTGEPSCFLLGACA